MVTQGPWLDNAKTALLQSLIEKRTKNVHNIQQDTICQIPR